jgi:hypothetical protein
LEKKKITELGWINWWVKVSAKAGQKEVEKNNKSKQIAVTMRDRGSSRIRIAESSVKRDQWQCYGDLKLGNLPFDWGTHRLATTEIDLPTPYSQLPICVEVIWISNYKETKKAASVSSYRVLVSYKLLHFLVPTYNYARGFEFNSLADFFQIMK